MQNVPVDVGTFKVHRRRNFKFSYGVWFCYVLPTEITDLWWSMGISRYISRLGTSNPPRSEAPCSSISWTKHGSWGLPSKYRPTPSTSRGSVDGSPQRPRSEGSGSDDSGSARRRASARSARASYTSSASSASLGPFFFWEGNTQAQKTPWRITRSNFT